MNALAMLAIGWAYQFSHEFMPYHAEVIGTQWIDLTDVQQILYIGMMRTEAAGFLATSTALLILLFIPFRQEQPWSISAMTVIGLVEYLPSAIATFNVYKATGASTPWLALIVGMFTLLLAWLLANADFKTTKERINSD